MSDSGKKYIEGLNPENKLMKRLSYCLYGAYEPTKGKNFSTVCKELGINIVDYEPCMMADKIFIDTDSEIKDLPDYIKEVDWDTYRF